MCTPQLIQQAAQIKAAKEVQAANNQAPQEVHASISQISDMFDPSTGQRVGQVGPQMNLPMIPITRAEFEQGPVNMMHEQISQMPRMPIPRVAPIQPIQRTPTVGELLGIKPGTYQEVGAPPTF